MGSSYRSWTLRRSLLSVCPFAPFCLVTSTQSWIALSDGVMMAQRYVSVSDTKCTRDEIFGPNSFFSSFRTVFQSDIMH